MTVRTSPLHTSPSTKEKRRQQLADALRKNLQRRKLSSAEKIADADATVVDNEQASH
jgi:hypothetical protein